jgi:hypothetical protein
MSINPPRKVIGALLVAAVVSAFAGCSSPTGPSASQESDRNWKSAPPDAKKKMTVFVAQMAAVYRALGHDVKKGGYHLVFTDVGPESMERGMPDLFATLLKKGSGGGVEFRGFSNAVIDAASVRDKKTGEQGVVFTLVDMKDDSHGGLDVSGAWSERQDAWREVRYRVVPDGENWRVQ